MYQQNKKHNLAHISEVDIGEQIKSAIQNVSINDRYQRRILVFFLLVSFFTQMQGYASSFFYMNPVFTCEGLEGKTSEQDACAMINFCKIINSGTVTAQLELYCDSNKDSRTLIQTTAGFGNLLGLFLVGWFSDRKGRKACFCFGLLILNLTWICQLVGVHAGNIPLLLLAEFAAGISSKMAYLSFLVILTRFLKKDGYELGTLGWLIVSHGISQIAIAGLIEYFNYWKAVAYVYSVGILVCSIISIFILKEDPVFLFDTGKLKESKRVIQQIGEENGVNFAANQENLKKLDHTFEIKMLQIEHRLKDNSRFNLKEIIRCDIFQKVAIIGLAGCFYHLASKSIELSIQNLQFSYNFNLFIIGVSNITGFLTAIYVTKIEPQRKRGLIYTSLLYGIIGLLFIFPFCNQNGVVQTCVIFCLRFCLCWSCNFYTRLKVDSFPEKYQLTIIGIIEFFVNFGTIIAPTLIQMSVDHEVNPIISMDILRILLGTLPVFFLMEERVNLLAPSFSFEAKNEKIREIEN